MRLSSLAIFVLITISNLVGCMTGRLGPLEDAADIAVLVLQVDAVAHQATQSGKFVGGD
jgi:hypothetical protein